MTADMGSVGAYQPAGNAEEEVGTERVEEKFLDV